MRTCFVCVFVLLVCRSLAMPTSTDDTEELSTTESWRKAKAPNKPAAEQKPSTDMLFKLPNHPAFTATVRYYKSDEAAHQESETWRSDHANAEDSELADDILDGKKAVVMAEIFKSTDNKDDKIVSTNRRSSDGTTTADKQVLTTTNIVTENRDKVSDKTESSSQNADDKNASSEETREVRGFDINDPNASDESDEDDMEVAETIIFRPLFSYRQDTAARRRSFRDVSRTNPGFDYY